MINFLDEEEARLKHELEFLRYFYSAAGEAFGPADDDVYCLIKENFTEDTGLIVPEGY